MNQYRLVAALALSLALLMKLAVPTDYMVGGATGAIAISVCDGFVPMVSGTAHPGMEHHDGKSGHQAKMPCGFASVAAPALASVGPVLLAVAIVVVIAVALQIDILPRRAAPAYLRPPPRGPPTLS